MVQTSKEYFESHQNTKLSVFFVHNSIKVSSQTSINLIFMWLLRFWKWDCSWIFYSLRWHFKDYLRSIPGQLLISGNYQLWMESEWIFTNFWGNNICVKLLSLLVSQLNSVNFVANFCVFFPQLILCFLRIWSVWCAGLPQTRQKLWWPLILCLYAWPHVCLRTQVCF